MTSIFMNIDSDWCVALSYDFGGKILPKNDKGVAESHSKLLKNSLSTYP